MKSRSFVASMGMLLLFTGMGWANDANTLQVRLQNDGSLSGRLRMFYATGKSVPADAKITVLHDGNVMGTAATDELGHFNLAHLEPGHYVARAEIETGTTSFPIHVSEYAEGAEPAEMLLDATLTPTPDGEIIEGEVVASDCIDCGEEGEAISSEDVVLDEGIVGDEILGECTCGNDPCTCELEEVYVEEYVDAGCCCGGFSDSGGCGGGGGGGIGRGLVGLAGLAGLAGLGNNDDDDDQQVSPSSP